MAKPGPKRKYETPEALKAGIDEYFATCKAEGDTFPDYAGMRTFLGVSKSTLERYQEGDSEQARKFRTVLENARDVRESWLARRMATEPRAAQGCMNNLKQPQNGGYIDRPSEGGKTELTINLAGVGGESAFK